LREFESQSCEGVEGYFQHGYPVYVNIAEYLEFRVVKNKGTNYPLNRITHRRTDKYDVKDTRRLRTYCKILFF
jgi:hypothetical protein